MSNAYPERIYPESLDYARDKFHRRSRRVKYQKLIFLFVFFLSLITYHFLPSPVLAAKPRVWKTTQTTTATSATRPTYSVKLRSDRRALNVTFNNVNTANSVSYELTYLSGDLEKGVFGSILSSEGNSATRSLLFGTCSKAVCTYHSNISNMQFKITAKLKTGKTLIKRYTIKV